MVELVGRTPLGGSLYALSGSACRPITIAMFVSGLMGTVWFTMFAFAEYHYGRIEDLEQSIAQGGAVNHAVASSTFARTLLVRTCSGETSIGSTSYRSINGEPDS